MTLDNIKILLSLTEDDSQDEILTVLLSNAVYTIMLYLGVNEMPQELNSVKIKKEKCYYSLTLLNSLN